MKKLTIIISSLVFATIIATVSSCKSDKNANKPVSSEVNTRPTLIAYVDIDSFEASYQYLKEQREKFSARQKAMENELQRSMEQLQSNAQSAQQKAQSGNMTEAEMIATQKKLGQMQQSLELRQQSLTGQLLKEKDEFNEKLHKELDAFLKEYNKDKKYDYILSYSSLGGSQILLANPEFDITADVIKGMNARAGKMTNSDDSTKKK